jgi:hypothetical protein
MKFTNEKYSVNLEIESYQFPNSKCVWDANWLNVKATYIDKHGKVKIKNDPALLASDLILLKAWLLELTKSEKSKDLEFMEPNIAFKYVNNILTLILSYESSLDDNDYIFTLTLNENSLHMLIDELNTFIDAFPVRN